MCYFLIFCTVKVSCNFHSHFPLSWNRGLYFNVFFITLFSDRYQEMGKTEHWNCITGKYPDLYRGDNKSWILKLQSRNCKIQKNKWPRQFDNAKSLPDFTTDNSLISENKAPLLSTPFSWIAHPQPSLLPTYQSVSGNLSIFSLWAIIPCITPFLSLYTLVILGVLSYHAWSYSSEWYESILS